MKSSQKAAEDPAHGLHGGPCEVPEQSADAKCAQYYAERSHLQSSPLNRRGENGNPGRERCQRAANQRGVMHRTRSYSRPNGRRGRLVSESGLSAMRRRNATGGSGGRWRSRERGRVLRSLEEIADTDADPALLAQLLAAGPLNSDWRSRRWRSPTRLGDHDAPYRARVTYQSIGATSRGLQHRSVRVEFAHPGAATQGADGARSQPAHRPSRQRVAVALHPRSSIMATQPTDDGGYRRLRGITTDGTSRATT